MSLGALRGVLVAGLLLLAVPTAAQAPRLPPLALLGTWEGILERGRETRTVEIVELTGVTADGARFKARTGVSGQALVEAVATATVTDASLGHVVIVAGPTRTEVVPRGRTRLDGQHGGQGFRLWKAAAASDPRTGVWEGTWKGGVWAKVEIRYADKDAASVRYEWGDDPARTGAGFAWHNVKLDGTGAFTWTAGPQHTFAFTPGARGALDGRQESGDAVTNTISMRRVGDAPRR